MKFKSNVKVTQEAPVNFEDLMQDMDNVLNMELEEAVEHLEDLTILEQNISKYGVTEPVMHLVGGTLESWSIDISNKEACLEGIGDKLKEAGKKVWEVIVKIYEKIVEVITGDKFFRLERHLKDLGTKKDIMSKKIVPECVMSGIIDKKHLDVINAIVTDPNEKSSYKDEKVCRRPGMLNYRCGVTDEFADETMKDSNSGKGYGTLGDVHAGAMKLINVGRTSATKAKRYISMARTQEIFEGINSTHERDIAAMLQKLTSIVLKSIVNMAKLIDSESKIPEGVERVKAENV